MLVLFALSIALMRNLWTNIGSRLSCAGCLILGFAHTGIAQTLPAPSDQEQVRQVEVAAKLDADERAYERFLKAMDRFDAESPALAPQAKLRFLLVAKNRQTRVDELKLTLAGTTVRTPIALTPDNFFTVERDELALNENATIRTNRKDGSFNWSVDVRTPGLPPHTRRLGDLRLECRVEFLAANLGQHMFSPLYYAQTAAGVDPCAARNFTVLSIADEPVFLVALVQGMRRQVLPTVSMYGGSLPGWLTAFAGDWQSRDRLFEVPLWDRSWPDDTLVELEPMRDALASTAESSEPPPIESLQSVTRDSLAHWLTEGKTSGTALQSLFGRPEVTPFSNGAASWVFRTETGGGKLVSLIPLVGRLLKPERKLKELRVIIGPDGIVKQYRLEEMMVRL